MAGDWIKMRSNLWDDPRIARVCDLTGQGEAAIVGALYWLWSAADQHSEDGVMPGLTIKSIDRKSGVVGFGDALIEIGWLADHPEGVRLERFEEHNGASAKRRCTDAQRKATGRSVSASKADNVRTESGQNTPNLGAREREEKNSKPKSKALAQPSACASGFSQFWQAYPKKRSKGDAEKAWKAIKPDEHLLEIMLAAVQRAKTREDWIKNGGEFIPYPAHWLRAKGWEDGETIITLRTRPDELCVCCGVKASKRIGQRWFCAAHDQYSEKAVA